MTIKTLLLFLLLWTVIPLPVGATFIYVDAPGSVCINQPFNATISVYPTEGITGVQAKLWYNHDYTTINNAYDGGLFNETSPNGSYFYANISDGHLNTVFSVILGGGYSSYNEGMLADVSMTVTTYGYYVLAFESVKIGDHLENKIANTSYGTSFFAQTCGWIPK